jgi:hypothetical protein
MTRIETLISELDRARDKVATTHLEIELLDRIKVLAKKCQSEPHLYLKFYGD